MWLCSILLMLPIQGLMIDRNMACVESVTE